MHKRIIVAIEQAKTLTYSELEARANKRGISLDELDELLIKVGKDKNIKSSVVKGEITYKWSPPKPVTAVSHVRWISDNYPKMDSTNDGSGIDADYSYLFLSPEELKQYKADVKGMPLHLMGKTRKKKVVS